MTTDKSFGQENPGSRREGRLTAGDKRALTYRVSFEGGGGKPHLPGIFLQAKAAAAAAPLAGASTILRQRRLIKMVGPPCDDLLCCISVMRLAAAESGKERKRGVDDTWRYQR